MNQKFQVIYADPPWLFKTYSDKGKDRSPEQHYSCMTLDDIKNLPIQDITDENCVLFLWATYPMLEQCIATGKAWGFTYKTVAFTWIKLLKKWKEKKVLLDEKKDIERLMAMGLGYITRANPEICLYFTKGKPGKPLNRSVRNLVISEIDRHSKKPIEVAKRIDLLYPEENKIELFAREKSLLNWTYWGDEIDSDIKLI